MKKILLLSFSILALEVGAQITITSADMPTAPKQYLQTIDSVPTISIGSAGANQVWNMAALKDQKKDTINLLAVSATPYAAMFSTANLAYKTGESYLFLNNSIAELTTNGLVTTMPPFVIQPLVIHTSPVETMLKYPSTFGTTFTDTFGSDIKIAFSGIPLVDSVRYKTVKTKNSTADAWGSITTPYGTFNCLRFKEILYSIDSTFFRTNGVWNFVTNKEDSTKTYNWLTNNLGFPLVSAEVNFKTDSLENVSWVALPNTVSVKKSFQEVDVIVYPNPAPSEIRFKLDATKIAALYICDIAGKMIYSSIITNEITTVDVSKFANATYNYAIISKDNNIVKRGKFNVTK